MTTIPTDPDVDAVRSLLGAVLIPAGRVKFILALRECLEIEDREDVDDA